MHGGVDGPAARCNSPKCRAKSSNFKALLAKREGKLGPSRNNTSSLGSWALNGFELAVKLEYFMKFNLSAAVILSALVASASAAEPWRALVSPSNSLEFKFVKDETPVAHLSVIGWGPNWRWVGLG